MAQVLIRFSDIRDAFDYVSFGQPMEHAAYLCMETGRVYWHSEFGENEEPLPDDIDESERYVCIPHKNDLGLGRDLVLRFAEEYLAESYDNIRKFFSRRGAYARFKGLLENRSLLEKWYGYEANASEEALRQWCADNEIPIRG